MTEPITACLGCGHQLSERQQERGFRWCWSCWQKSKETANAGKSGGATLSAEHIQELAEILGESDSIEEITDRMCQFLEKAVARFDEVRFREAVNGGPLPQ